MLWRRSIEIQHLYQCTHEVIHGIWTALVDTFREWLEASNTEPDIAIILAGTILYIAEEINDLLQCTHITLHSDILHIGWPSIILGIIPTSLARTQQTYFTHIERKKNGIKTGQSTHDTNL